MAKAPKGARRRRRRAGGGDSGERDRRSPEHTVTDRIGALSEHKREHEDDEDFLEMEGELCDPDEQDYQGIRLLMASAFDSGVLASHASDLSRLVAGQPEVGVVARGEDGTVLAFLSALPINYYKGETCFGEKSGIKGFAAASLHAATAACTQRHVGKAHSVFKRQAVQGAHATLPSEFERKVLELVTSGNPMLLLAGRYANCPIQLVPMLYDYLAKDLDWVQSKEYTGEIPPRELRPSSIVCVCRYTVPEESDGESDSEVSQEGGSDSGDAAGPPTHHHEKSSREPKAPAGAGATSADQPSPPSSSVFIALGLDPAFLEQPEFEQLLTHGRYVWACPRGVQCANAEEGKKKWVIAVLEPQELLGAISEICTR